MCADEIETKEKLKITRDKINYNTYTQQVTSENMKLSFNLIL